MEKQWDDTDREKPKASENNLPQCHFIHHKSLGVNLSLHSEKLVTNHLCYGMVNILACIHVKPVVLL
jgi:hypothetical protein